MFSNGSRSELVDVAIRSTIANIVFASAGLGLNVLFSTEFAAIPIALSLAGAGLIVGLACLAHVKGVWDIAIATAIAIFTECACLAVYLLIARLTFQVPDEPLKALLPLTFLYALALIVMRIAITVHDRFSPKDAA